jgi:hypothetical protein
MSNAQAIDVFKARYALTHEEAHVDDKVAIALLRTVNPLLEPKFVNDAELRAHMKRNPNDIPVGTGGGALDDHGGEEGRPVGAFATLLAAKLIEVDDDQVYKVLLEQVGRSDLTGLQNRMEWGEITKTLFGHAQDVVDAYDIFGLIEEITKAHLLSRAGRHRVRPVSDANCVPPKATVKPLSDDVLRTAEHIVMPAYAPAEDLCKAWLLRRHIRRSFRRDIPVLFAEDEDHLTELSVGRKLFVGIEGGHISTQVGIMDVAAMLGITKKTYSGSFADARNFHKEITRPDPLPFDFVNVMAILASHGSFDAQTYYGVAEVIFDAYAAAEREKHVECPEAFREHGKLVPDLHGLRIAFVTSDLRKMRDHLKSIVHADVMVIRRSTGNVAIFTGHDVRTLAPFITESIIRTELDIMGWSPERITQYVNAERRIDVKRQGRELAKPLSHWYYQVEAGRLMNGSNTHEAVPTKLTASELEEAVTNAVKAWWSEQDKNS